MKKRILIPKTENMEGETSTSRKGSADVLGEFYAKLHDEGDENVIKTEEEMNNKTDKEKCDSQVKNYESIPEFTAKEVQEALDRLKRGKAGDSYGIKVEHMKRCDSETKEEWIRQIFNEIVQQEECTPQTWRRIRVKVIHTKG